MAVAGAVAAAVAVVVTVVVAMAVVVVVLLLWLVLYSEKNCICTYEKMFTLHMSRCNCKTHVLYTYYITLKQSICKPTNGQLEHRVLCPL